MLTICENLTSMRYRAQNSSGIFPIDDIQPMRFPTHNTLTKLDLDVPDFPTGADLDIIKSCPVLRWFSVKTLWDEDIFQVVQQYCPDMNIIITSPWHIWHDLHKWEHPDEKFWNSSKGLKWLTADYVGSGSSILPLIEENHTTLRRLALDLDNDLMTPTNWQRLSSVPFCNLTHHCISRITDEFVYHCLETILKTQTPVLQSLQVGNVMYDVLPDGVIQARAVFP